MVAKDADNASGSAKPLPLPLPLPEKLIEAIAQASRRMPIGWTSSNSDAIVAADGDLDDAVLALDGGRTDAAGLRTALVRWYRAHTAEFAP